MSLWPLDFQILGLHLGTASAGGGGGHGLASTSDGMLEEPSVAAAMSPQTVAGAVQAGGVGDTPIGTPGGVGVIPSAFGTSGTPLAPGGMAGSGRTPFPSDTGGGGNPFGGGAAASGAPVIGPPSSGIYAGKQFPAGTLFTPQGIPYNPANLPGSVGPYQGPPTSQLVNPGVPGAASQGGDDMWQEIGGIFVNNPYSEAAIQAYGSPQDAASAMGINLANWTPEGNYIGPVDASGMPTAVGGHYAAPSLMTPPAGGGLSVNQILGMQSQQFGGGSGIAPNNFGAEMVANSEGIF